MDLTPKQQTSEAVRQAESILITTAQHPSIDQAAAVIGLGMILRKFGKKVSAVISDSVPVALTALQADGIDKNLNGTREFIVQLDLSKGAEPESVKYTVADGKLNLQVTPFKGGWTASDVTFAHGVPHYDLALVLGVPTRARIDRIFNDNPGLYDSVPVVNLDFHRSNENFGAINLIEPTASSLSEILVALSESLQNGLIDENIATVLLTGIVASTDRFTASHTTSKSLTVAAQLMAAGGRQQAVVKALYQRDQRSSDRSSGGRSDRQGRGSGSRGSASGSANPAPVQSATASSTNPSVSTAQPTPPITEPLATEPQATSRLASQADAS